MCDCQAFATACHCQPSSAKALAKSLRKPTPDILCCYQTRSFSCIFCHEKGRSPCDGLPSGPAAFVRGCAKALPKLVLTGFRRAVFGPWTAPFLVRFWAFCARRAAAFGRFERSPPRWLPPGWWPTGPEIRAVAPCGPPKQVHAKHGKETHRPAPPTLCLLCPIFSEVAGLPWGGSPYRRVARCVARRTFVGRRLKTAGFLTILSSLLDGPT